jgi:DNA-binding GntR family transcriptional regulator
LLHQPIDKAAKAKRTKTEVALPEVQIDPQQHAGCRGKVYKQILQGIYEGRYVPGQRLIEADMTRELKVSRGSVREALNQLAAQGIISQTMHRGSYVRALSKSEVFDVLSLIEVLMGLAAKLAAEKIEDPQQRKILDASLKRLSESREDRYDLARARDHFYAALTKMGGNMDLARTLESVQVVLVRIQFLAYRTDSQYFDFTDCSAIGDAILTGDAKKAEQAGRQHIQRIRKLISQLPDYAFA